MAAPATLKAIDVEGSGRSFTLRIEDEQGNRIEFVATRDQLDILADRLDDVLLDDGASEDPAS